MFTQGKSKDQLIVELEREIKLLKDKLAAREMEMAKREMEHSTTEMWMRVYRERYLALLKQASDLKAINNAIMKRNQNLESALKAFKFIINTMKRKEM